MKNTNIRNSFYGWKNVGLLFFILMCGNGLAFYSFSVIFPVMIKDLGWQRGQAGIALTLCMFLMGYMAPVLALAISRFGVKRTMVSGLVIMVGALILLGAITTHLWIWILLWGFVRPVGFAFGGIFTVQTTVMFWFNARRALALSIVTSGAALAGFISQPFFTWLMGWTESWQIAWLVVGGGAFIALILSFFVKGTPREIGQNPDGLDAEEVEKAANPDGGPARTYRSPINWPLREALKKPALWLFILLMISHGQALSLIMSHGILHMTDVGYTSMQAASVLSLIILASGVAALPTGWLADRIEPRWLIGSCLAGMLITFFVLWKAPNLELLTAAGLIFGMSYGAMLILLPATIGNYFGPEAFPRINGFLVPLASPFMASVPAIAGFTADKTGSYDLVFAVINVMLIVGTICAFLLTPPKPTFHQEISLK
ncbi:MAG: MFS transporter [Deltaproteobacteria bacterium]|nr:MFS transporter [Deltaproteobacteria bacterium]